jgi:Pyrimidine dimer DNA glycosylase
MNIFVTSESPIESAKVLPDKHIVKMPLESCQMISIIYSKWYHNWGTIPKSDGNPYNTEKGAFRNHPCTVWASENYQNLAWLIKHGLALCSEYTDRYGKIHSCQNSLTEAARIFFEHTNKPLNHFYTQVKIFARAMPDDLKNNTQIDTFESYRLYLNTKPWIKDNYIRIPNRKPEWIV